MPASPRRRVLHWLTGAACLTAASSQAPPASTIPYSKCIGCEQAALLSVHFVSKEFYCHPDGSKADKSCAAAHGSPAACCAACLKVNAEKKMCDAWFMNEQGGCFFKKCPPSAWKSGECHIDPKPSTPGEFSGIPDGQFCSGWGTPFVIAFVCCVVVYVAVGVGYNVRVQGMALAPSSHPHFLSWTQLGGLVVDGALFSRARLLQGKEPGGVGEALVGGASTPPDSSEHEVEDLPE